MIDSMKNELLGSFVGDLGDLAIITFDADGRIVTWNAGAQAILGYEPDEIVGRHSSELMGPANGPSPRIPFEDSLVWGRHETTLRLFDKRGCQLDAQVVLRPVRDPNRNFMGFGMLAIGVGMLSEGVRQVTDGSAKLAEPETPTALVAREFKVLVVDDDDLVREQLEDELTSLGYRVYVASSGTAALGVLERVSDIDLLFADVVMPNGMGGRELALIARRGRPGLKVLFTSGYFQDALEKKGELATGVELLVKPYRRTQLVQTLDRLLKPNDGVG